jgi:hypothetical protein
MDFQEVVFAAAIGFVRLPVRGLALFRAVAREIAAGAFEEG